MKTYRNPQTGHKQLVDEKNAGAVAALEAQGYVEWGAKEIEARTKDQAKAVEEAKAKLAAAQKEMSQPPAKPKPLNANAQVETEADIASVTVETKQPSGASDVTTVPAAPAVPKKSAP
jgi:hypothetical protein